MRDKDDTQDIIAQLHAIRTTTLLDGKDIRGTGAAAQRIRAYAGRWWPA